MVPPPGLSASPSFASPGRGDLIAGRYRIERKIGSGGMGIVVAATDQQTGQRVAIKLLLPEGPTPSAAFHQVDDSGIVERSNRHIEMSTRLIREASAAARLSSEHVTRVLDVGRMESGDPYVVMELLEGVDLNRYAKERGPLPIVETVNLVLQACEAIFEAHERGIVHRDLKPANLFLTERADRSVFVKVLDFGISKVLGADDNQLTATSDMLGSPLYMAPEQIRNARDVDARADVWSLGTILYRLLAGRAAFEGQGSAATLAAIIGDAPYPLRALRPDVPPDLEAIVLRCLEKDRTRRVQSVRELAIALQRFAVAQTGSMLAAPIASQSGSLPVAQSGSTSAAFGVSQSGPVPIGYGAAPAPLPPPPGLPSPISVGPSSVTTSARTDRSVLLYALIGLSFGAIVAAGLFAWKVMTTSTGAPPPATSTTAIAAGPTTEAPPAKTAEPTVTAIPSTSASVAAAPAITASATTTASAASSVAPIKPRPTGHGRPSDDPLGDRL